MFGCLPEWRTCRSLAPLLASARSSSSEMQATISPDQRCAAGQWTEGQHGKTQTAKGCMPLQWMPSASNHGKRTQEPRCRHSSACSRRVIPQMQACLKDAYNLCRGLQLVCGSRRQQARL